MKTKILPEKRVRDLMGRGYPLIKTYGEYYVPPYGKVDNQIAEKMINHALVRAGKDGLWPGLDQTYRMIKD
jgi:hypothetical protein